MEGEFGREVSAREVERGREVFGHVADAEGRGLRHCLVEKRGCGQEGDRFRWWGGCQAGCRRNKEKEGVGHVKEVACTS